MPSQLDLKLAQLLLAFRNLANVRRRRTATTASDIEKPGFREFLEKRCGVFGALVVFTKRIRQTRVGVKTGAHTGHAGKFLDVRAQVLGAERAVQADADRPGVRYRIPERFRRLSTERSSAGIGNGARNHYRQRDRKQRRLAIERIEYRFHQQHIDAAFDEPADRFGIARDQFVEADIAESGIVDVRRNRCGGIGRSQHAGYETRLVRGRLAPGVGALARQACCRPVELNHPVGQPIVGHRHRVGIESVGFDNVGAGFKESFVNSGDDFWLGQRQQVVVAALVAMMVVKVRAVIMLAGKFVTLNHGAHGTIENQNALG